MRANTSIDPDLNNNNSGNTSLQSGENEEQRTPTPKEIVDTSLTNASTAQGSNPIDNLNQNKMKDTECSIDFSLNCDNFSPVVPSCEKNVSNSITTSPNMDANANSQHETDAGATTNDEPLIRLAYPNYQSFGSDLSESESTTINFSLNCNNFSPVVPSCEKNVSNSITTSPNMDASAKPQNDSDPSAATNDEPLIRMAYPNYQSFGSDLSESESTTINFSLNCDNFSPVVPSCEKNVSNSITTSPNMDANANPQHETDASATKNDEKKEKDDVENIFFGFENENKEFKKWLGKEKFLKAKTIMRYISTILSMEKEKALDKPNRYLQDVRKSQSKTTFNRKYWALKYWSEYAKEREIGEMDIEDMYF